MDVAGLSVEHVADATDFECRGRRGWCHGRNGCCTLRFADSDGQGGHGSVVDLQARCSVRLPGAENAWDSSADQGALMSPIEGQIEPVRQPCRAEVCGVTTLQDRLNDVGCQKRQWQQPAYITRRDACAIGDRLKRSCSTGRKLLEPEAAASDCLDQRGIHRSGFLHVDRGRKHQLGFDPAAPERDRPRPRGRTRPRAPRRATRSAPAACPGRSPYRDP